MSQAYPPPPPPLPGHPHTDGAQKHNWAERTQRWQVQHTPRLISRARADSGMPRFPPPQAEIPSWFKSIVVKWVTVDFPFVPVTATRRSSSVGMAPYAKPSSEVMGTPHSSACWTIELSRGIPGESTFAKPGEFEYDIRMPTRRFGVHADSRGSSGALTGLK